MKNTINKKMMNVIRVGVLPLSVSLAMSQMVHAAGVVEQRSKASLEEVVVTAQKRKQSLQKTSLSVTAVNGERLNEQGLSQVETILKDVPGVIVQAASRGQMVSVRGFGFDLPAGVGEVPVALNFDGIFNFRNEAGAAGMFDVSRVEVLRGPQSTLYGRNATAGVVNVISEDPSTDKLKGYGTAEFGNYANRRFEGALNIPISEQWAARLAFVDINRDGYYKNNGGNDNVSNGFRAKLLYRPNSDFSLLLGAEHIHLGGKGTTYVNAANWAAGNYYVSDQSPLVSQKFDGEKLWLKAEAKLGDGVLTFIPSYQLAKGKVIEDNGPFGLLPALDPKKAEQQTLDVRYAALPESPVQWVVGLYTYNMKNTGDSLKARNALDKTDSVSVYGQATIPVADSLRAILGLRHAEDKKSFSVTNGFSGMTFSDKSSKASQDFKLGLEYDVSEQSLAYATISSGHRPHGFNSFGAGTAFEGEKLTSYELGTKNRFMNGRLQVNASAFFYDYKNYQLSDFYNPAPGIYILDIKNVDKVSSKGLELEVKAKVFDDTQIDGSVTLLDNKYKSNFILHDSDAVTSVSMLGKQLPHSPKTTIRIGVQQNYELGSIGSLLGRLDIRHIGDQYLAPLNNSLMLQKAYTQADASLTYISNNGDWSINAYVRNITDKAIATNYLIGYVAGAPRTYGMVFTYKF